MAKSSPPTKGLTSIILPVWIPFQSKEKYIRWTLISLADTTDRPFELIVINNEVNAASKSFINQQLHHLKRNKYCKRVKVIYNKKNEGWTGAIEQGIKESKGEYVNWTNDDLVFEHKWLSKLLKHFKKDTAAVGPVSNFTSGIQDIHFNKLGVYEERVNYLIGFSILFKRLALDSIFENGHYVDPIFFPGGSEELDVCIRLKRCGWELLVARDVFVSHFGNKSLDFVQEFKENQNSFYKKRLDILTNKYDKEQVSILVQNQKCPKFVIGIPTIGKTDFLFMSAYAPFLEESWKYFGFDSVLPMISPRNLPHIARNEIVRKSIMYGAEYLFFLDDDMVIPTDSLIKLYKHNLDYVSALAYQRVPPFKPCIYAIDEGGLTKPDFTLRQGLKQVDVTGLSCCLIKMKVLKDAIRKIVKKSKKRSGLFRFTEYGEDFNLGFDLARIGIKIYADTDLVITHIGNEQMVNDITCRTYHQRQLGLGK